MPAELKPCIVCENEIPLERLICPYCESEQPRLVKCEAVRTVNLEDGKPTVPEAMERLRVALTNARDNKVRVLRIIHGY